MSEELKEVLILIIGLVFGFVFIVLCLLIFGQPEPCPEDKDVKDITTIIVDRAIGLNEIQWESLKTELHKRIKEVPLAGVLDTYETAPKDFLFVDRACNSGDKWQQESVKGLALIEKNLLDDQYHTDSPILKVIKEVAEEVFTASQDQKRLIIVSDFPKSREVIDPIKNEKLLEGVEVFIYHKSKKEKLGYSLMELDSYFGRHAIIEAVIRLTG